jgi:predicted AlkP superfamily phosphohydrolase/phosphomutase
MKAARIVLGWILCGLLSVTASSAAPKTKKVFVLGVDGLDPKLLQIYMDEGLLPNFKRLVDQGHFKPLQTSMPPLSPVAWSTFITGMDPGGHGVYDFIHRDPATLMPCRAESGVKSPRNVPLLGCAVLPVGGGPENLRQGQTFWEHLEEHGVPTTIFRMAANFPPIEAGGKSFSGMGTPDIRGTPGTFSFFSDGELSDRDLPGGKVYAVRVEDHRVQSRLYGPLDPFHDQKTPECRAKPEPERRLNVEFDVFLDPEEPVAKIVIQDDEFVLRQGEWSDWVRVDFKALPLFASVSALGRFYLKQVRPGFELYVTPLQINPEDPGAMQISTPGSWSHELCEELGYFYTQELPEDTKALSGGILTGREFWQQSQFVFEERHRAFDYFVDNFEEGLLFFYFSSIDQNSHMLWRYMDPHHPGFEHDELLIDGIQIVYRELDEIVGRALQVVDDDTTFILMSDHGFAPFNWQVNLNSWLVEQGYAALRDPSRQGQYPLFTNVDWNRTKVYALGLNGLYVNLRGRERHGIVNPGEEYERLLERLERDLLEMVDPLSDRHPVSLVINSRRDFHGPLADDGPDLLVGYSWGYRSSWASPLGEFPREIFVDNDQAWSGDHSMDYRLVPGVLIANRPITLDAPALYDLTVAILDEYGVEKPAEMIGQDCLGDR